MKEEEKTENDSVNVKNYVEYIYNLVSNTDFSDQRAYGKNVSRIFSGDIETGVPENRRHTVAKLRSILKSFASYILTILYSESEKKKGMDDEEEEFLEKNKIVSDDGFVEYGTNGEITVSYDIDSLASKILSIDENTIKVLADYDHATCSGYLFGFIHEVVNMVRMICKYDYTKVDITGVNLSGNKVEFTIDCYADSSESEHFGKYATIPTYKTKFGERVINALSDYSKESGTVIVIGLDSITDNAGKARKSVRVFPEDKDIIEDDADGYQIDFSVISEELDPIDNNYFNDLMTDRGIEVHRGAHEESDDVQVMNEDGEVVGVPGTKYIDLFFVEKSESYDTRETGTGELFDEDNPIQDSAKKPSTAKQN